MSPFSLLNVLLLVCCRIKAKAEDCEVSVLVSSPWGTSTYIPLGSMIRVNCSNMETQSHGRVPLHWSIMLPGRSISSQFGHPSSTNLLNNHSIYMLPIMEANSIQLLINNTEFINGTVIQCVTTISSSTVKTHTTTIITSEPTSPDLIVTDNQLQSVNISWSPSCRYYTYTLTVTNSEIGSQSFSLDTPYFTFTAPEDAPPCEVYNFSVTATYVGATYTGAGCSVPSPVLSKMLPSLPNFTKFEYSLTYLLKKKSGEIILQLFMPSDYYCEEYPVINYTLVITSCTQNEILSVLRAAEDYITVDHLSDNAVYVIQVIASNVVGAVSTSNRTIYTTDVQMVRAVVLSEVNKTFSVQCDFIIDSDAQGCMVILVGEYDNVSVALLRHLEIVSVPSSLSCYKGVVGFDIERDGQIGTLAVPGKLFDDENPNTTCLPNSRSAGQGIQLWLVGLIILPLFLIAIMISFAINRLRSNCVKLPQDTQPSTLLHDVQSSMMLNEISSSQETPWPLYDLPNSLITKRKRSREDEDHQTYSRTVHRLSILDEWNVFDGDSAAYACLQDESTEHHYHVLECQDTTQSGGEVVLPDPDAPEFPPPFKPVSATLESHPIYQEITDLSRDHAGTT